MSLREIATLVGRHHSVVGRELARNAGPAGHYHHQVAHRAAHERRRRPKAFKLAANPRLCTAVEGWLGDGWSPQLIATVLRQEPWRSKMDRVGHETIYQALYVQGRGGLRRELAKCLSTGRTARKPRGSVDGRGKLYRDALKIADRPAIVEDRAVPGHWEGDLVVGTANGSAVGTLVERTTRFVMLLHLPGRHDAESVAEAMIKQMGTLPEQLRQSLTWDRGVEMARYRDITLKLEMPVYFCDPHSPWQRGTNENTNRLLRHWLTKGTDLSRFTAKDLDTIAAKLNARPRPTLDLKTPAQALAELLANPAAA
jgi:IS30 family transposase